MYEFEQKEFIDARQLIREGKYEAALQLITAFEQRKGNSVQDILLSHLAKSRLLIIQGHFAEAAEIADQTYKESLKLGNKIITVDALICMALGLLNSNNLKKINEIIKQVENLLKSGINKPVINKMKRCADVHYLKGMNSDPNINPGGDVDLALKYYKKGLDLSESIDDKDRINSILLRSAWIIGLNKGDLDLALNYIERALAISRETNNRLLTSWGFLSKATMYQFRGEISKCILLYNQSLEIAKEINHPMLISGNLNNMAESYRMVGEFDRALEYSQKSIEIYSKVGDLKTVANYHDFLIQILIEKGDLTEAQRYLNELENLNKKLDDVDINELYLYNKALLLKESPRISNRGEAEIILKQILESEPSRMEVKQNVLLALCDLLLLELQMTGDLEVLEEVEPIITELLEIAENSHSFWVLGEIYLLQAKLALISLDFEESRRLMTKGEEIAEKYGLELLARKISNEHDKLLNQLNLWDNLKDSEAPLTNRMKLARLNEQMEGMLKRHAIEKPEVTEETPVLLLIVSEGGVPHFSQSFVEDQIIEDHLFGGFFTAINSFINEKFSEGLDRAVFGDYTLLMNSLTPFFICYVFKGQSYSALHRIKYFIDEIRNDEKIWSSFKESFKISKEIQLKDVPSLEPLIREVFIF